MDTNLISKEKSLPSVLAWLKATYEYRHGDATPKREVYKAYKQFCIHHNLETTNAPAFGKILRMVFPTISSRRLGKRGQTSHHYNNFRKRADAPPITAALSYYFHSFPAHAAPPLPPSSSFMASPSPSSSNNSNNSGNSGFHSRSQSSSPPLSSSSPASSMHSPITASTTAYFYNHSAPNLPSTTAAADGRTSPQQKQHYHHHPPHHYSSAPSSSSFSPTPSAAAAPSSTKPSSTGYSQQDLNHISRSIHQLHQSLNSLSQHQQQHQSNDPPQHSPPPLQQQHQIQSHSFPIQQQHLQDRCSSSPSPSSYPSSASSSASSSSIYYSVPSSSSSSQQYHRSSTYSPPPSHSHSLSHSPPPTQHPRSQPHPHHSSTSPPVLHQRNHHHSSPEFSPSHHRVYEERPPPQQHRSQQSHHHYHQQQHYHHQQQPLPPSSYSNSRPYHSPPQIHHYATTPSATQFNQHEQHLSLDSLPSSATSSTGTIATASSNSSNGEEDRRSYSSLPSSNTVASVPTTAASTIRTNSNAVTTDTTTSYDVSTYSGLNLLRDRTSKDFTAMMDSNITPYYPLPPYAKRRRSSLLLAAEDPTSTPLPIPEPLMEADHLSNGSHLPPPLILPQPRQSFSSLTLRYREDAIGGAKVPELNEGRRGGIGEDKNTRRLEEWDELTSLHFPFNEGHRGSIFGISGSYLASGVVSGRRRSSVGLALGYSGPPWMMTAPAAVSVAPSASSAGPYASTTTNTSTTGDNTVVNRGGGEGESFDVGYDASVPPLLPAERGQVPQFVLNTMELVDEELRQQARLFNTMYRNHFQLIFDALCNDQRATILDSNDTNDRRRKRQRVASASVSSMEEQWQENNHPHDISSSLKRTNLGENTKDARHEELRKNRSENDIGAKNKGQEEEEEHRGGQKELDAERRANAECKDGAMSNSGNCSFDFDAVANYLKQFWPQTKSFYHLFTQEVIIEQIVEIDAMLYSSMLGLLMPYLFQSLPPHVTDQIVWFAQVFVGWVKDAAAAHIPILLLDMKLKVAENFSKALLSRAAINRLSSRLREALAQEASLPREANMLSDWERVDFTYVDGQTTPYGDFRKIPQTIKEGFPPLLSQHLQVEDWARWVMQVSERVMNGFYSPYIPTIPEFLLKWTTYCSLLESCLTVQAAKNMRRFVLLFRWLEALLTLYLDEQDKSKRWNEQIVEEEQRNSQQLWQRRMSETAMQQPRFSATFGSFSFGGGTMNAAAPPGYNVWENFNSNIRAVGQLHRLQEIAEEPGREENQVVVGVGNERIPQLNIQNNKRAEDSHQHQLLLMNGHHVGLDEHPARDRMDKSTMPYAPYVQPQQRRKESLPGTSSFCNIPSDPGSSGGAVNGSGGGLIPGIHDTFGLF